MCTNIVAGIVLSMHKQKDKAITTQLCLQLLRAVCTFANLGTIRGMIAVDQVGNLSGKIVMYVKEG